MIKTLQTYVIGMLDLKGSLDIARRIYEIDYISPCINAHGSDTVPKILIRKGDKYGHKKFAIY